ncbi:MAG: transposase, partial [Desulfobacteraceae bacterium]|nr:transposase [Desulfobacteraceae bacterium]
LLKREGWKVNHKRVYRLYKQEGLMMRPKRPRRHVSACRRVERPVANRPDESWFLSLEDAREKVETWRQHYNRERSHEALGNLAPVEFAKARWYNHWGVDSKQAGRRKQRFVD